jgi:hypothetical protein
MQDNVPPARTSNSGFRDEVGAYEYASGHSSSSFEFFTLPHHYLFTMSSP